MTGPLVPTEAHGCEQTYPELLLDSNPTGRESNPRPLDRESDATKPRKEATVAQQRIAATWVGDRLVVWSRWLVVAYGMASAVNLISSDMSSIPLLRHPALQSCVSGAPCVSSQLSLSTTQAAAVTFAQHERTGSADFFDIVS